MAHRASAFIALVLTIVFTGACGGPAATLPTAAPAASTATAALLPTAAPQTPAASDQIAIALYDLGPSTIEQTQEQSERRNMPYRIQGLIAAPAAPGPHPLIVVTHGAHPGCPVSGDPPIDTWPCPPDQEQRNDLGWRYLLEALAREGYVAVSLNMNAVNTVAWGGLGSAYERYASVLDTHLSRLIAANRGGEQGFGLDLTGQIDFSRTALVGHGQGGGHAILYAAKRNEPAYADAGGPLVAALLVAPAPQHNVPDLPSSPNTTATPDLPIGIVMGLCDGDVPDLAGFAYYEQARAQPQRSQTVQVVVPHGANHTFFNAVLGAGSLEPEGAPGCGRAAGRLSPAQQQAFLAAYAQDFFATVFSKAAPSEAWQPGSAPPQQLYGVPVLTALLTPAAARQALVQTADGTPPADTGRVTLSVSDALDSSVCRYQSEHCDPARYGIPAAQNLNQLIRLSWKQRGETLRLTLPPDQRDLSPFAALQLRAALDGFEQANSNGQALTFRLRDTGGKEASVTLPAETHALQPPAALVRDAGTPETLLQGVTPLAAVRVPLAGFAGVDLTQIESIAVVFDQSNQGAVLVTDLELLR
ncbi:MAG TPA: hypothetical protein VFS21_03170 [Roseiflexaceae bacterium]|nr:hypothetical protein [Roseiflexaceae bacterium]